MLLRPAIFCWLLAATSSSLSATPPTTPPSVRRATAPPTPPPDVGPGCVFASCGCNCTASHTGQGCWQPNGTKQQCDCDTGAGCWGKPAVSHALPSGCAASELKVCVAAHSGRGGLIPLGSICAPQCPAGFVNTSIFCPKAPTGTEVALDCLFHMNPVKPNEPGFNKTCACPGPKTQTNPDGCTCLSGCAMEGCATDAACGGGRVCNKRSQFHVCLYPWDTQACGAGVEDLTDEEFWRLWLPGVLHTILD
jgi:hypothetical protein